MPDPRLCAPVPQNPVPRDADPTLPDAAPPAPEPLRLFWDVSLTGADPWTSLAALQASCPAAGLGISRLRVHSSGTVTARLTLPDPAPLAGIEAALRRAGLTLVENTVTLTR